jgi:putative PEP-CTERM system TPR-repeat lipoprotein
MYKIIITCILALFLLSCAKQDSVEQLINLANESIKNKKHDIAIIHLKSAIKQNPNIAEVRFLLGNTYLNYGNFISAESEFEKAFKISPNETKYIAKYYKTLNQLEDYNYVTEDFKKRNNTTNEEKLHAAYAELNLNNEIEFNRIIATIYNDKLSKSEQNFLKLLILVNNRDEQKIIQEFANKINSKEIDIEVEGIELLGHIFTRQQQYSLAVKAYEIAFELRKKNTILKFYITQNMLRDSQFENAKNYTDQLLNEFPNHALTNQLAGQVYLYNKKFKLAKQYSTKSINSGLKTKINTLVAGVSSFHLGAYQQAKFYLSQIELPKISPVNKILTATNLKLGFIDDAVDQLLEIEPLDEIDIELLTTASINLIQSGELDNSKNLIDKIKDTNITATPELLNKIAILKLKHNDLSGIDYLINSIESDDSNVNSKALLISSLISSNQLDKARVQVSTWMNKTPNQVELMHFLAYIELVSKNPLVAKNIYNEIISISPFDIKANMYFALNQYNQKNYNLSTEKFKLISEHHKGYIPSLLGYYLSEKFSGDVSSSVKLIGEQSQKDLRVKLLLIKIRLVNKENEKAKKLLTSLKKPTTIALVAEFRSALDMLKNTYEKSNIKNWRKLQPNSENALIVHINLLKKHQYFDTALNELTKFKTLNSYSLRLNLIEIDLALLNKNLTLAENIITKLDDAAIKNDILDSLKGRMYFHQKNYKAALTYLNAHYTRDENYQTALQIYISNIKLMKKETAIKFLEIHLSNHQNDNVARLRLADELMSKNKEDALTHYLILTKNLENNVIVLNNTAWLLSELGRANQGLEYIKQALDISPDNPILISTLNDINKKALY